MKIWIITSCCLFIGATACRKNGNRIPRPVISGQYKLDKVEILKDGELKKLIKEDSQYWRIYNNDSIRIYTDRRLQNSFPIRVTDSLIQAPSDSYMIDKLSPARLELSSIQVVDEASYTVVYYLDKQ